MKRFTQIMLSAITLGALTLPMVGQAQTLTAGMGTAFNKRVTARLGYFWSDAKSKVRLDSSDGQFGTEINFEDDLGLQSSKGLSMLDLNWRLNLHHRIEASYVSLNRSGDTNVTADIRFGDDVFTIGTEINSKFQTDIWRVAWGWSWINNSKFEFGTLLGLHVTQIEVGIRALDGRIEENKSTTAPLPTIGLHGTYAFTPKLHLRGFFQWFALEYDKYDGSLFNASAALDYYAFDNFGIGIGYSLYDYDLKVDDTVNLKFDYEFKGPMAYANLYF